MFSGFLFLLSSDVPNFDRSISEERRVEHKSLSVTDSALQSSAGRPAGAQGRNLWSR